MRQSFYPQGGRRVSSVKAECLTKYLTSATIRIKGKLLLVLNLDCNKDEDVDVVAHSLCCQDICKLLKTFKFNLISWLHQKDFENFRRDIITKFKFALIECLSMNRMRGADRETKKYLLN